MLMPPKMQSDSKPRKIVNAPMNIARELIADPTTIDPEISSMAIYMSSGTSSISKKSESIVFEMRNMYVSPREMIT